MFSGDQYFIEMNHFGFLASSFKKIDRGSILYRSSRGSLFF